MPLSDIFIIGGGICGMASAIALSKALHQKKDVKITVFELRDEPSALGGAVGLTPSAMRHLDHIGVLRSLNERKLGTEVEKIEIFSTHSGSNLMNLDFVDGQGKGIGGYKGRRVMRRDLLLAMTDAARDMPNVTLEYGKKVAAMENSERSQKVKVLFEGGATREADLVLGCDGIHSNTRMKFVEPERVPVYTGICTAQGYARTSDVHSEIHFKDTGLNMSRRGSLLTTYYTRERDEIYLAAVMEVSETLSRDGWKAKGEDQEGTKRDMMDRFGAEMIPAVRDMIAGSGEWFFYPVYKLENGGKWHRDSVMLLGDAAHAMPPQGESIGLALEDALLFARVLAKFHTQGLEPAFSVYENLRRQKVEDAHREASKRWENVRDSGYLVMKLKEIVFPAIFWWTKSSREKAYLYDTETIDIPELIGEERQDC